MVLSAVASVPAWWTSAQVKVCKTWSQVCDDDNSECIEGGLPEPQKMVEAKDCQDHSLRLPGDPKEIVGVLFPRTRGPRPRFYYETPRLEVGREEQLFIHGENLWRNPKVLVGHQEASGVRILPDMGGLLATFARLYAPAGWLAGKDYVEVDAWVVTSEGTASAGLVQIFKARNKPKEEEVEVGFDIEPTDKSQKIIVASTGDGALGVRFKFDQKKVNGVMTDIVKDVVVDFDATLDPSSSGSPSGCLDKSKSPWEITTSCEVTFEFLNLQRGQIVKLTAHDKKEKAKKHPLLEFRAQ